MAPGSFLVSPSAPHTYRPKSASKIGSKIGKKSAWITALRNTQHQAGRRAAGGAGLGPAFLRHVQRCKVLLHVVDGSSEDPIGDFTTINGELEQRDPFLAQKPQVVVLNKIDIPEVKEKKDELMEQLRAAAGHFRVLSISAVTTERVQELMGRLKKFADAQPVVDLPPIPEIDLGKAGLDYGSDDYEIVSDPSYPGQWRIRGEYIEQVAKMTHWEYPEAVARFGRQL
eukprot:scaffold3819_cov73-Cylindrotheca_fusiformis.AAC.1